MQQVTYSDLTKDKDRVVFIKEKLATDDRWLIRGLLKIYEQQTADEQATRTTRVTNAIGFSAFDADFLTGMAKRVQDGYMLTPKQQIATRKAMAKYAGQLVRIARLKLSGGISDATFKITFPL